MNKTVTRRILLNGFLALALVPCLAQAQRTIPVEVVNTSAAPMPVVVQSGSTSSHWRLVGVTAEEFRGNSGFPTMNNACDATYPGSRMCTTEEITKSTGIDQNYTAWVNSVDPPLRLLCFLMAV